jgi:anthraniloyl-CoA monooxygenase
MRVHIVGGGPAGLYFAILMKKCWPETDITVFERNAPDDTFGFGVVFSDETLDHFEASDRDSYRALRDHFAYWDDIEIHFRGSVHRVGGNGFCGCARTTLLRLLQQRARYLGVTLRFRTEITDWDAVIRDADLVVAADGVASRIRESFADRFRPSIDMRPNFFSWMGSTRPFDAFTFFFRETEHGIFIAHCYQYEPARSTWITETDPATFARAGLAGLDEAASARFVERIFAEELKGYRLITNRSIWRNFPAIRCERWVADHMVLLGDAKATAHFSIGSGTKLAMEDAITLARVLASGRGSPVDLESALSSYEAERRTEALRLQNAARNSMEWFENVRRYMALEPEQFAYSLLTRSQRVSHESLRLRDAQYLEGVERWVAAKAAAECGLRPAAPAAREARPTGGSVPTLVPQAAAGSPQPPMFTPLRLRGLTLANRVVVSPMDMYSAVDGTPNDFHLVHLGARALGGAGLVMTEMTCVSPEARISLGCTGMYAAGHLDAWRRITSMVHQWTPARICLQLGHSGARGSTKLMWEGNDVPLETGGWPVCGPSPFPYRDGMQVPREMSRDDMRRVCDDFVRATRMAVDADFDMLELHCAHGYLLSSFITPLTNRRRDEYGGSLANRLRFPLEVFTAMRSAWPAERPMSVRISATDWVDGGVDGPQSVEIARAFQAAGADIIHVSAGQTSPLARPVYGRMFQTPLSDRIRNEAGIPTIAVGNITEPDQVNAIIASGRADLCALARPHLSDPNWTLHAAAQLGYTEQRWPVQYLTGKEQLERTLRRQRELELLGTSTV